uniref:Uncharacterized protein n=1 Tax=Physcomitrium patens TaxID=3218 RepID=A0A2K1IHC0_PHYPA|nr:hypothetical protein PHYPA_029264 [Physcomitrium patens]
MERTPRFQPGSISYSIPTRLPRQRSVDGRWRRAPGMGTGMSGLETRGWNGDGGWEQGEQKKLG